MTEEEWQDELDCLAEFAELEGSEQGEATSSLLNLYHYRDYLSAGFSNFLEEELITQLRFYRETYKIVEKDQTFTSRIKMLEEK